jgi:ADP-ribosylglycohydrolase
MTSVVSGSRARHCLLAAAVADSGIVARAASDRSLPFDVPRLSNTFWLALATCEAMARSGGRIGGEQAALVLREWFDARRFPNLGADSMKPLRDLAAGVHWTQSGGDDDGTRAAAVIRIAPLAFVLDAATEGDRVLLADVVRITSADARAIDDAQAMLAAMRSCLDRGVVADVQALRSGTLHPSLAMALQCASDAEDLESALVAASACDDPEHVGTMTGLLLGAAGCEIPSALVSTIPERETIDAVIEPFTQLLSMSVD